MIHRSKSGGILRKKIGVGDFVKVTTPGSMFQHKRGIIIEVSAANKSYHTFVNSIPVWFQAFEIELVSKAIK
jgi:hypothetical protein